MPNDVSILRALNVEIGQAEMLGDRQRLDAILAPTFAFQRADGTTLDRKAFLDKETFNGRRIRETEIESIALYRKRAVVSSISIMNEARVHNLCLFIKQGDEWKLLGWAIELL